MGCSGSTSSTSKAALSAIRRAPQLGQKPRRLQLKATRCSAWQDSQRTRRKPCSSRPHWRNSSNSRNLLSNALRYTPEGQAITVSIREQESFFDLVIENPGKPIPEEHLSRLFDRFYRVDPSRQRKGEGSGIGLAIVKSIVEAHHGRVQVESDVRSTRFILSVPRLEKMIPETQC